MSAIPNNAGLELIKEELIKEDVINGDLNLIREEATAPVPVSAPHTPSTDGLFGHEALQALLAFSSLHEQIRRRRQREKRNGRSLTQEDNWQLEQFVLDEVLQLVAERALAITGADGVALALADNDAIVCRASAGKIAPDAGMRLDPNAGFSGECLVSGRIVRCDDVETDPRVNLGACRRLGVRSIVAVPLSARQNVIGLLEAFSSEPFGFNDSDVRSLNLLAELILSAMRPEEEDRLAEISRRVVHPTGKSEAVQAVEPEPVKVQDQPTIAVSGSAIFAESSEEVSGKNWEASPEQNSEKSPEDSPNTIPIAQPISISPANSSADEASDLVSSAAVAELETIEHPTFDSSVLDHSTPGLAVVAAVLVLAASLGAGVWWILGHQARSVRATTHPVVSPLPTPESTSDSVASTKAPAPAALTDDDLDSSAATSEQAGLLPQVTGIRHWSSADSSTVVIDIQDQVQYEAHRLPNPERIYFDLQDTALTADLANRIISVDDALLQRVRVAQPMAGVTRVVLETKGPSDFSVSLEPHPYRLVVEVRKLGNKPRDRAKIDLFAPADVGAVAPLTANPSAASPNQLNSAPLNLTPVKGDHDQASAASTTPSKPAENPALVSTPKLVVVLDAGHGGWDLGTVGRKGLLEKDLVLDIVERTGHLIESRLGAKVVYTRQDDTYLPLEKRAEIANLAQAKLFISVHANYSDYPSARGVETYYSNTYSSVKARTEEADDMTSLQNINWTNVDIREKVHESRRIAASVQHSLYGVLAAKNPGLPNRGVKEAHYVVLTGTSMPAILAEVSFVSSPTDENNLQSSTYRQQIAEALYNGIARYESSIRPVKIASAAKPTAR